MSEANPLRRWRDHGAPDLLNAAFAEHAKLGPDPARLEQMLSALEQAVPEMAPESMHAPGAVGAQIANRTLLAGVGATFCALLLTAPAWWAMRDGASTKLPASLVHQTRAVPQSPAAVPEPPQERVPRSLPPELVPPPPIASSKSSVRMRNQRVPDAHAPLDRQEEIDASSLIDELALLRKASRALSHDPKAALAIAAEHAAKLTRPRFAQEREVVAIDALLRLGRRAEAEGRAQRFVVLFPNSLHTRRIEALLEKPGHRLPSTP